MIDGALPYLRCPVCGGTLARAAFSPVVGGGGVVGQGGERALRCPRGHSFDIARQGYVTLTAGRAPHPGDSAGMVADRETFLAEGHYDFIADALAKKAAAPAEGAAAATAAVRADDGLVVDAGTGTGRYLARVLDALPGVPGLGLDVSKPALRRAARSHPRAAAVLADLWRPLPLADAVASVVLNVFAPRNGPEFRRILRPDGRLLVVTPARDHLAELIDAYGLVKVDPDKADRVADALGGGFEAVSVQPVSRTLRLSEAETRTLIGMTPSARHVPPHVAGAHEVTAAVDVTSYRPV
ncbi:putative RNA methyltransferase [Actinoplanes sp. NPDC049316]|uniref:putative RNA methyltransferase n=1 Tax=Actinoplanes sp. NPDC049316 TaxID=3154727 RepID=UPI003431C9B5